MENKKVRVGARLMNKALRMSKKFNYDVGTKLWKVYYNRQYGPGEWQVYPFPFVIEKVERGLAGEEMTLRFAESGEFYGVVSRYLMGTMYFKSEDEAYDELEELEAFACKKWGMECHWSMMQV